MWYSPWVEPTFGCPCENGVTQVCGSSNNIGMNLIHCGCACNIGNDIGFPNEHVNVNRLDNIFTHR